MQLLGSGNSGNQTFDNIKKLIEEAKYSEVIAAAGPILKKDPDNPRINELMGSMYLAMKNPREAEPYLAKALERDPGRPETYMKLAQVHAQKKEYGKACGLLEEFIKIEPDTAKKSQARTMLSELRKKL